MNPAISLENVHFSYNKKPVLSGIHLSVEQSKVLSLLGPSGSGKTSVLRLILGLAAPAKGLVRLGGEVVSEDHHLFLPAEKRGLAVVFQDLALWPHLSVLGNLRFGLDARRIPRHEAEARTTAMLERLGLADMANRYPGDLSGGERQRVAIARALVLEPRAILLDEPLSNLDVSLKRELLSLFRALFQEHHCTVIYVTHDFREAAILGDRIAVIESGCISQIGSLNEMKAKPASKFIQGLINEYNERTL